MALSAAEQKEKYNRCVRRINAINRKKPKSKRVNARQHCRRLVKGKRKKVIDVDYEVGTYIDLPDGYVCEVEKE